MQSTLGYPSAAINTKQAGECTAQFLLGMEENNEGFKASDVHAIGFSLGAHVASFASTNLIYGLFETTFIFVMFQATPSRSLLGSNSTELLVSKMMKIILLGSIVYQEPIIHLGLDPALPFFATARQHWKLDSTDGYFKSVLKRSSLGLTLTLCSQAFRRCNSHELRSVWKARILRNGRFLYEQRPVSG